MIDRRRSMTSTSRTTVIGDHKAVDLGLPSGLLWADEDLNGYYAYGSTESFSYSPWYEVQYYEGDSSDNYSYVSGGSRDAATAKWGNGWRTPTFNECSELIRNVTIDTTKDKAISKINEESISFTKCGGSYYDDDAGNYYDYSITDYFLRWTSTGSDSSGALGFLTSLGMYSNYRKSNLMTIRPVHD